MGNELKIPPSTERDQSASSQSDASLSGSAEFRVASKVMAWNTKFPPAAYFEEFAHIIPNGAERLFEHFIAESEHRRLLEKRKQLFPLLTHVAGRAAALVFALAAFAVAMVAIVYEAYWIAVLFGGGMIASAITAFITLQPEKPKRPSSD